MFYFLNNKAYRTLSHPPVNICACVFFARVNMSYEQGMDIELLFNLFLLNLTFMTLTFASNVD